MKAAAQRPSKMSLRAKAMVKEDAQATPPLPDPSEPERRAITLAKESTRPGRSEYEVEW